MHLRRSLLVAATVAGALSLLQPVQAIDRLWIDPAGGNFSDPGNWNTGIPGPADNAVFNLGAPAPYTVTLTDGAVNARLLVRNDDVTFTSSGSNAFGYRLASTTTPGIVVGESAGNIAEFTWMRGVLTSTNAVIGLQPDSTGTMTVTGPNVAWTAGSTIGVGDAGTGTLNILQGATVSTTTLRAGMAGSGDVLLDTGARLDAATVIVGDTLEGLGSLTIQGGASAFSTFASIGRGFGTGSVIVEGAESRWTLSQGFEVARSGFGIVDINDGARITASGITLGTLDGSDGTVTVSGENTQLASSLTPAIIIGRGGVGALVIQLGGRVSGMNAILGDELTGDGTIELIDAGSTLAITGNLLVGDLGAGEISISAGASATTGSGTIANGSVGTATVAGTGSSWIMSGNLDVGVDGQGTLAVTDGGLVRNTTATIGRLADALGEVTVDGAGSRWENTGAVQLGVGVQGQGLVYIESGGRVTSLSAMIGAGGTGGGLSAVFISDAGSNWTTTADMTVGGGIAGVLELAAGGTATSQRGFLAAVQNGSGLAMITGPASTWTLTDALFVGGNSTGPQGDGVLELIDGGAVSATNKVTVWSSGAIVYTNGSITAAGVDLIGGRLTGTGILNPPLRSVNGTIDTTGVLTLNGQLSIESIAAAPMLTKTGAGRLVLNGTHAHEPEARLLINAGAVDLNTDAGGAADPIVDLNAGKVNFNSTQHLAALNLNAGTATLAGTGRVLVTNALTLGPTAKLDIDGNAAIVRDGSPTAIRTAILAGRGVAPGGAANAPWNGATGITSAAAAAAFTAGGNESRSVGYALNSALPVSYTTFRGEPVGPDDVLIRFTKHADADLNGAVDDNDVSIVGGFYNPAHDPVLNGPRFWHHGDFNGDGKVDDQDVTVLGGFYAPSEPPVASAQTNLPRGILAVPEPLVAIWILLLPILTRRPKTARA